MRNQPRSEPCLRWVSDCAHRIVIDEDIRNVSGARSSGPGETVRRDRLIARLLLTGVGGTKENEKSTATPRVAG